MACELCSRRMAGTKGAVGSPSCGCGLRPRKSSRSPLFSTYPTIGGTSELCQAINEADVLCRLRRSRALLLVSGVVDLLPPALNDALGGQGTSLMRSPAPEAAVRIARYRAEDSPAMTRATSLPDRICGIFLGTRGIGIRATTSARARVVSRRSHSAAP